MSEINWAKRLEGVPLISAAFTQPDPNIIPLTYGFPSPSTFPKEELIEATTRALNIDSDNALQYTGGKGVSEFPKWIKERSKLSGINIELGNILVTSGSGQAIDLITRTLTDPGDTIWIEAPSYFGALRSFQLAELNIEQFPIDEYGVDVEKMEEKLQQIEEKGASFPKLVYVITNHHNPKGVSLSLERRKKLAKLAEKYHFYLIEDDAYAELNFDDNRIPAIYSFCPERVIYLSSFSKVFGPGLRIGWTIASKEFLTQMRTLKSDGNTSVFVQEIMYRMLEKIDIDLHLEHATQLYKRNRDAMMESINEHFNNEVSYNIPKGGLYIWLTFKEHVDTDLILQRCKEKYNVTFFSSKQFYYKDKEANHMRLCFSYCSPDQLRKGVSSIAKAYYELYS